MKETFLLSFRFGGFDTVYSSNLSLLLLFFFIRWAILMLWLDKM